MAYKRKNEKVEITVADHPNHNEELTKILQAVGDIEKAVGNMQKYKAYSKAVKALRMHPKRIETGEEAIRLEGIGKKIAAKIDEIRSTGKLRKLEKLQANTQVQSIMLFSRITGVGPAAAKKWVVEDGLTSLDDLKRVKLTHHQEIGLRYFDEFEQRIPRAEMEQLEAVLVKALAAIDPAAIGVVAGSYRRGAATSGDIDMLITHPEYSKSSKSDLLEKMVKKLTQDGFLTDELSFGKAKYMGVCRLAPDQAHRRVDLLLLPYESYGCGILYFTGSDFFNIQMRNIALEKGWTLSEYSMCPTGETGVKGEPIDIVREEDVFEVLGLPYRPPAQRSV